MECSLQLNLDQYLSRKDGRMGGSAKLQIMQNWLIWWFLSITARAKSQLVPLLTQILPLPIFITAPAHPHHCPYPPSSYYLLAVYPLSSGMCCVETGAQKTFYCEPGVKRCHQTHFLPFAVLKKYFCCKIRNPWRGKFKHIKQWICMKIMKKLHCRSALVFG